uniref:Rga2 protein n=1 Tax=Ustanciosporium gigantosporum TaxID=1134041 RepID=H2CZ65_9BASI|nr:Rga2 protein [Ustanciosporium gigantosporum]
MKSKQLSPIRVFPMTRENRRPPTTRHVPRWIDQITSVQVPFQPSYGPLEVQEMEILRSLGSFDRVSKDWRDPRLPRICHDRQICRNRISPYTYETYENRFGRFRHLAWKTGHRNLQVLWDLLADTKYGRKVVEHSIAALCTEAFSQVINCPPTPRSSRRRVF